MDTTNEIPSVETVTMHSSGELCPSEEAKVKVAIVTEDWLRAAFGQAVELAALRDNLATLSSRVEALEKDPIA